MADVVYPALVLIVSILGIIYGFRRGITGQISSLLGFGFGAVCARVFAPRYASSIEPWISSISEPYFLPLVTNLLCASGLFIFVYAFFSLSSSIFRDAMSVFEIGMFNRLVGTFFSLTISLLWLSIILNICIALFPDSSLMKYEKSDDGNMVAVVMALTPSILGCYGADDFAHRVQLKHAKTISCNFKHRENVINS